ncbi:MAG: hypothetical protein A2V81_03940 [Candidatus Abawacabacteria bacterium RBG_16_42_10]|uniref:PrgI family protein n=1 Tax=Candidatus Abawacabacteria bacterium RBG_16_42_10 TaxID=1817814 RepID=A0A1F4XLT3_9BACT|nr:MAG: hypothetical protein A2V81_03940 [Candidatus Abawacabacteria bacterium RBG_16_42_10]
MAQFKVPQNVQRADTIIGPLTMMQLIIAVVGGGLAYIIYLSLQQPVATILAVIIVSITAAFVLIRIHDMPFWQYLASLLIYILKPRLRVWEKGSGDIPIFERYAIEPVKAKKAEKAKMEEETKKFKNLKELTSVLDTEGQSDMDEATDEELVQAAFKVTSQKKQKK